MTKSKPVLMHRHHTLGALDEDGTALHFTDYVGDGDEVDIWDDPETEEGYRGARIVYRDGEDWRARKLTEGERQRRLDRIRRRMGLDPGPMPAPFGKGVARG